MMRSLSINLARRPFRNNTVYWAVFISCFALLTAASAWNAWDFIRTGRELEQLDADLAQRTEVYMALHKDVQRMQKEVSQLNLQALNSRSTFANSLILSRFFSWSYLFDRIEEVIPPDVKIRAIRPAVSPKGIEISLDGLARNTDSLYEFEMALDGSPFFSGVYPLSESTREHKNEINFDLVMNYLPAGEHEEETPAAAATTTATTGTPGSSEPAAASEPADPDAQTPGGALVASGGEPDGTTPGTIVPPPAAQTAAPAGGSPALTAPGAGVAPRPAAGQAMAPPVNLPRPADPNDPRAAEGDPATWSDEDFIKAFGQVEFLRQRGPKGKGKGKAKAKAAPADPNGVSP